MFSPLDPGLVAQYTKQIEEEFTWLSFESADVGRRSFPPKNGLSSSSKNRYKGFVAFESTRVRLSNPGCDGDDYINANFISGEVSGSESWYISCQAPLEATFCDFWRMVWEQKSGVIVMLTNLVENGKVKAERYWPAFGEEGTYGNFIVAFHKEFPFGDKPLVIRSFRIRDVKSTEKPREIVQIQFCDWPDFGVPSSTKHVRDLCVMLTELKNRADGKGTSGPAVLHCSAGVGRAGTFIALHIANERFMRGQVPLDLMSTVRKLRTQRRGMVQTASQYEFLYQCTKESLMHRLGLTHEQAMRLLLATLPADSSGKEPQLPAVARRLTASLPNIANQHDVIGPASPPPNTSTPSSYAMPVAPVGNHSRSKSPSGPPPASLLQMSMRRVPKASSSGAASASSGSAPVSASSTFSCPIPQPAAAAPALPPGVAHSPSPPCLDLQGLDTSLKRIMLRTEALSCSPPDTDCTTSSPHRPQAERDVVPAASTLFLDRRYLSPASPSMHSSNSSTNDSIAASIPVVPTCASVMKQQGGTASLAASSLPPSRTDGGNNGRVAVSGVASTNASSSPLGVPSGGCPTPGITPPLTRQNSSGGVAT